MREKKNKSNRWPKFAKYEKEKEQIYATLPPFDIRSYARKSGGRQEGGEEDYTGLPQSIPPNLSVFPRFLPFLTKASIRHLYPSLTSSRAS